MASPERAAATAQGLSGPGPLDHDPELGVDGVQLLPHRPSPPSELGLVAEHGEERGNCMDMSTM
jgi:hypothetical protein